MVRTRTNMEVSAVTFFNMMTEEDLITVAEMGKLDDLCLALSLDLNSTYEYEKFEA
tara:strand:- start:134 stop:301 length:168 start_codon:yes stop_codon:yes gene_type:complete